MLTLRDTPIGSQVRYQGQLHTVVAHCPDGRIAIRQLTGRDRGRVRRPFPQGVRLESTGESRRKQRQSPGGYLTDAIRQRLADGDEDALLSHGTINYDALGYDLRCKVQSVVEARKAEVRRMRVEAECGECEVVGVGEEESGEW